MLVAKLILPDGAVLTEKAKPVRRQLATKTADALPSGSGFADYRASFPAPFDRISDPQIPRTRPNFRTMFWAAIDFGCGVSAIIRGVLPVTERYNDLAQQNTRSDQNVKPELAKVKACVFDTFGTIVDWRGSVIAEAKTWGKSGEHQIDWVEFTDRWRLGYRPAMDRVRNGEIPWTKLDDLHRMILEELLRTYRIEGLSEAQKADWAHVWRRLRPWPDSVDGLTRLKKRYIISPLSNGNLALMASLAKFAGLPWDLILGSDLVQHYKPDRDVYLSAPFYLDLKPEEVMMCAAHAADLHAARRCGLRTGFIYRPDEFGGGPAGVPDTANPGDFDVVSTSIIDFAQQMGA